MRRTTEGVYIQLLLVRGVVLHLKLIMTQQVKLCHVVVLLAFLVGTLGNPICKPCPKGHYMDWKTCKCHVCPDSQYNNSPGRATRCQPCRKLCFDLRQTIVKQCTADHDILCECPKGTAAATQDEPCYDKPITRNAAAVQTKSRRMTPGPAFPTPTDSGPQQTPLPTQNVSRDQSTHKLVYSIIAIICVVVVGALIVCTWKYCPFTLCETLKVKFSPNEKPRKNERFPSMCEDADNHLRREFICIANSLSPGNKRMFLRNLPGIILSEPEIMDLDNIYRTTPDFICGGLTRWLDSNPNATREDLIQALMSCKDCKTAEKIRNMPTGSVANAPGLAQAEQVMPKEDYSHGGDVVAAAEDCEESECSRLLELGGMKPHQSSAVPGVGDSGQDDCSQTSVKKP